MTREVLNVMITVDTEIWPRCPDWRQRLLQGDIARDILGQTPAGRFGVGYQAQVLAQHGLKAVFFVEALFACEVGLGPLADIVGLLQGAGQEVQLHVHTEWLEWLQTPFADLKPATNIRDYSLEQQVTILAKAVENLRAAGATKVSAFRAGNYGANADTLTALATCGLRYDSSYNFPYLDAACGLGDVADGMLIQPRSINGVVEVPIACFEDYPGHRRHAQLCAVSHREMRWALREARRLGWGTFVIVSHGFELLTRRKQPLPYALPDRTVIKRFERLCSHLSERASEYRTVGFDDLEDVKQTPNARPLGFAGLPSLLRLGERLVHQARRRIAP